MKIYSRTPFGKLLMYGPDEDREKSEPRQSSESEKEMDPPGRARKKSEEKRHPYVDEQKDEPSGE